MHIKNIKSILLTTSLTMGLSLSISSNVYAATYTTVSGDSLYKISQIFSTNVSNLMNDNKLTNYNLNIGQDLYVNCETYTVKKGDTLYLISKKHNITLTNLRRANNIYTNYIFIGQKLNIPITLSTSTTTSVAQTVESFEAPSYSASDLDLLSRLIMAEAQGESYDAKVAVGAVVMNRVKSGLFTPTIEGVINQNISGYYQFTPVENGWINNPANSDSIEAAKAALNGFDPTNGALFYYDNTTTNEWILSKSVSITIGNMIYAY